MTLTLSAGWWDLSARQRARLVGASLPHHLYRCYDAAGLLLYVGVTSNPKRRLTSHKSSRSHVSRALVALMDRFEVDADTYPDKAASESAEAQAIATEQPLLNINSKRRPGWMRDREVAAYLTERGLPLAVAGLHCCPECQRLLGAHMPQGACQDCRELASDGAA